MAAQFYLLPALILSTCCFYQKQFVWWSEFMPLALLNLFCLLLFFQGHRTVLKMSKVGACLCCLSWASSWDDMLVRSLSRDPQWSLAIALQLHYRFALKLFIYSSKLQNVEDSVGLVCLEAVYLSVLQLTSLFKADIFLQKTPIWWNLILYNIGNRPKEAKSTREALCMWKLLMESVMITAVTGSILSSYDLRFPLFLSSN